MLPTPYLQIDQDRLLANIERVQRHATDAGIALRPHAKTHKSPRIARLQLDAGAVGLTIATVGEAEVFANAGCDDLFVAYPLWLDPELGARIARVRETARVRLGCDSAEAAARMGRFAPGATVLVEIDSGHHRSGVAPGEAAGVALAASEAGLDVVGVFTFPGHSYDPHGRQEAARQEAAALAAARDGLRAAGFDCPVVSGGSSPSFALADPGVVTELRPGVGVVNDAQQWELGACERDDIALVAMATVVSRACGNVIVNAGSKILGADRPDWASGYGRLLDAPDARVVALSEHHATITWPGEQPRLGDTVRVVPNHACNAINLVDDLTVARADGELESWPVTARGRNW